MELSNARVILYHKQATSARTLFLSRNESVCLFDGLPRLSALLEEETAAQKVALHPAALIKNAENQLHLDSGSLEWDTEFRAQVDVAGESIRVFLLRFKHLDPPREQVAKHGGRFIAITEARRYPPTELELLRRAYAAILEG